MCKENPFIVLLTRGLKAPQRLIFFSNVDTSRSCEMELSDIALAELRGQMIMHRKLLPLLKNECNSFAPDRTSPPTIDLNEVIQQLESVNRALSEEKQITDRLLRSHEEAEEQLLQAHNRISYLKLSLESVTAERDSLIVERDALRYRNEQITEELAAATVGLANQQYGLSVSSEKASQLTISHRNSSSDDMILADKWTDIAQDVRHAFIALHENVNTVHILQDVHDMCIEDLSYRHISSIAALEKKYLAAIETLTQENERLLRRELDRLKDEEGSGTFYEISQQPYTGCCKECAKILRMWEYKYDAAIKMLSHACGRKQVVEVDEAVQCDLHTDRCQLLQVVKLIRSTEYDITRDLSHVCLACETLHQRMRHASERVSKCYRQILRKAKTYDKEKMENSRLREKCRKVIAAMKAKKAELQTYRETDSPAATDMPSKAFDEARAKAKQFETDVESLRNEYSDKLAHAVSDRVAAEESAELLAARVKELEALLTFDRNPINHPFSQVRDWKKST